MDEARDIHGLIVALLLLGSGCCAAQSPRPSTGREISGIVVSAASGEPLADAHMSIALARDRKEVAETVTDAEGRFAFENLADGKYDLSASHRGYVAASYEQHDSGVSTAIVTGEGLISTGLRFELSPQATIYGTVAEDSGDPVPRAQVSLYHRDPRGTGQIRRAAVNMADAKGNFELSHLSPGAYFICAMGQPWYARRGRSPRGGPQDPASQVRLAALDVAYPPTCYPDVTDPNAASPILIAAGERAEMNLAMHPVPAIHLEVLLSNPEDRRSRPYPQFGMEIFGNRDQIMAPVTYITNGNGGDTNGPQMVEIDGLAPGQYDVEVPGQNGENSHRMSLDAAVNSPPIDLANATPLAAVSGKVTMAGGGSIPASSVLWLTSRQGTQESAAQLGADGTFKIESVRPGDYDVMVNLSGSLRPVVNLTAKGGALNGRVLQVGAEPIVLTGTVGEADATVNGVVKLNGRPKSGIFVVLAPADLNAGRGMWQANQSDSDGSFNMRRVAPGDYTVAAIEKGWTLDWSRAEAIAPYLAHGVKVTVAPGARLVDLKEAVEAQPLNLQQAKAPESAPAAKP